MKDTSLFIHTRVQFVFFHPTLNHLLFLFLKQSAISKLIDNWF